MIDPLHVRYAFALTVCLLLAACGPSASPEPRAPHHDASPERPRDSYVPGMGDLMSALQLRHAKLWHAGQAENWDLAAFELHEIEESFERVARWHPEEEGLPVAPTLAAHMHMAADTLQRSVAQRDRQAFELAFDEFTRGCNGCHQTMKHGFIVIRRPIADPVGNQAWKLEPSENALSES